MSAQSHQLTIERLSYGPAGIGRLDGKVVFVPGTVPGDTVEVAIEEDKKTYAVARLTAVRQPSAQRRQPPCPYIPRCGGCPWQHIDYAEQLRAKQALVEEQLRMVWGSLEDWRDITPEDVEAMIRRYSEDDDDSDQARSGQGGAGVEFQRSGNQQGRE